MQRFKLKYILKVRKRKIALHSQNEIYKIHIYIFNSINSFFIVQFL